MVIGKDGQFLHTVRGGPGDGLDAPPMVYIPGYGAGTGFLFRVMEGITAGWNLLAVGTVSYCSWLVTD